MDNSFNDIDQLTGLMKKEIFKSNIQGLLEADPENEYAIVSIDIDNFKIYNYYFGVERGDELLKFMGFELLALSETMHNSLTCRESSDRFFVFCMYDEKILNNKIDEFIDHFRSYLSSYTIKPSFGIYVIDDRDMSIELMINNATMAGKRAKGLYDKSIVYYTPEMGMEMTREQEIINRFDDALANDEFVIYYQPKYVLRTGRPFCSEALVRWIDSDGVFHRPDEFIPVYENNMLISKLDLYVFENVCKHIRELMDKGIDPYPVSVNVSLIDLFDSKLTERLLDIIAQYNISIKYIQLEFTETALFDNKELIRATIDKMHQAGFTILLDDFGKGAASLKMLNELAFDILKIDKGLLATNPSDSKNGKILTSIVNMAKWMSLPVIVEGVENKEQVLFLQKINCEYAQGFYYSEPIPEEKYDELLEKELGMIEIKENAPKQFKKKVSMDMLKNEIIEGITPEYLTYIAFKMADVQTWIYDHRYRAIYNDNKIGAFWDYGEILENVPYSLSETGLVHPDDKDTFNKMFEELRNGEPYVECVVRLKNKKGDQHYYQSHIAYTNVFDDKGNPVKAVGVLLSTAKVEEESNVPLLPGVYFRMVMNLNNRRVHELQTCFSKLRENVKDKDLPEIRRAVAEFFKFPENEHTKIKQYVDELIKYKKFLDGKEVQRVNFLYTNPDTKRKLWIAWELYTKIDADTGDVIGYNIIKDNDISYREELRLKQEAECDRMTGLLNHEQSVKIIKDFLEGEGKKGTHVLMMVDIDDFKNVNDRYGHQKGDEVIINIAKRLKGIFKDTDIIGRYGGDEFIVLAKNFDNIDKVICKAKNIVSKLSYKVNSSADSLVVHCSVGAAIVRNQDMDSTELRHKADEELYKVKNSGKNGYSIYGL